jgi:hypothetical protein
MLLGLLNVMVWPDARLPLYTRKRSCMRATPSLLDCISKKPRENST